MANLVELDLNSNALSSLPAPLATSLRALTRLDLSSNAFTRLPQARIRRPMHCRFQVLHTPPRRAWGHSAERAAGAGGPHASYRARGC